MPVTITGRKWRTIKKLHGSMDEDEDLWLILPCRFEPYADEGDQEAETEQNRIPAKMWNARQV